MKLQLHSNPISFQRSHIIIVIIIVLQPPLSALSSVAPPLRKLSGCIVTKHIQFPNLFKCCAEFLDAESIYYGVDGRVAMAEDDGNGNEEQWFITSRTKESDAVEDVKRKPANRKEEKNKGK